MEDIEKNVLKKHTVTVKYQESVTLSAVKNVISFDEKEITAQLADENVTLEGEKFNIEKLDTDNGELIVTGVLKQLRYSKGKEKRSFRKKVFK